MPWPLCSPLGVGRKGWRDETSQGRRPRRAGCTGGTSVGTRAAPLACGGPWAMSLWNRTLHGLARLCTLRAGPAAGADLRNLQASSEGTGRSLLPGLRHDCPSSHFQDTGATKPAGSVPEVSLPGHSRPGCQPSPERGLDTHPSSHRPFRSPLSSSASSKTQTTHLCPADTTLPTFPLPSLLWA